MCSAYTLVWLNWTGCGFLYSLLDSLDKFESDQGPVCLLAYLWGPTSELELHCCSFLIVAARVQALTTVPWIIIILKIITIIKYMSGSVLEVWHILSHLISSPQPIRQALLLSHPYQKLLSWTLISVSIWGNFAPPRGTLGNLWRRFWL